MWKLFLSFFYFYVQWMENINSIIQKSPFLKSVETNVLKLQRNLLVFLYHKKKEPSYHQWIYYSALVIANHDEVVKHNHDDNHDNSNKSDNSDDSYNQGDKTPTLLKSDKVCVCGCGYGCDDRLKAFCETLVLVKEYQNHQFFQLKEKYLSLAETQMTPYVLPNKKNHIADFIHGMKMMTTISQQTPAVLLRICWLSPTYKYDINHCIPTIVYFLSIKYICRDVELFVDLPVQYYVQHNEILSAEFVKYWLDYNEGTNVPFDMSYRLEIIDRDITQFTLTSTQYITLEKDTYHIMKRRHFTRTKSIPNSPRPTIKMD